MRASLKQPIRQWSQPRDMLYVPDPAMVAGTLEHTDAAFLSHD
jgi:hypothetical protein